MRVQHFRNSVSFLTFTLPANMTVAAISAILNKTPAVVFRLFVITAGVILHATFAHRHTVIVTYHRQARVSGVQMDNQYRDLQYRVTLGDIEDDSDRSWQTIDPDFNNPIRMMQNAIAWFR